MSNEEQIATLEGAKAILLHDLCDGICEAVGDYHRTSFTRAREFVPNLTFDYVKHLCKEKGITPSPTQLNRAGYWWDKWDKDVRVEVINALIEQLER